MVDTIGPMVRASPKDGRGIEVAHAAGGVLGGAATGFLVGALGAVAGLDEVRPAWLIAAIASVTGAAALVDARHEGKKLGLARQTPRAWRHVLPAKTAAFFNGFDLGMGWSTRIYFLSYGIALLGALVAAHALAGAGIGAAFGGARALLVVAAQRRSDGALSIDSIAARRGTVLVLNTAALLQFAAVAALAASGI